jgi:hypothetical protein
MMKVYPYNQKLGQVIQSDVPGLNADRAFLAHVSLGSPAAASNTAVHAAITLAGGAVTEVTTGITNPDVPRAIRIKGNAEGIAGNVVIEGTNELDEAITETIVAADAGAVDGAKAFKTVSKITVPARTTADDTISIGYNDVLGLPYKLATNAVLAAALNHVREATAPAVAASAAAIESNTMDLNSALNGNLVEAWLMV